MKIKLVNQSGFTLLELMTVVVLIGLIIGAVVLSGSDQRNRIGDDASELQLNQVAQALQEYYRVCGAFPSDTAGVGSDNVISDSCTVGSTTYLMTDFLSVVPSGLIDKNFIYSPLAYSSGDDTCAGYHISFETIESDGQLLSRDHDVDSSMASAPFVCDDISSGISGSEANVYDLVYPLYFRNL